ncbi:hypothetical protein EPI10_023245 [Gossypium australe]|uniref:Uncharacterized protein n=1 Tax=Gossypium australe TaxID=47621 RepID=A0A5B6VUB5_9ROSI|nr:hypothetical protein EPI10_023245 [Gossypium australe]
MAKIPNSYILQQFENLSNSKFLSHQRYQSFNCSPWPGKGIKGKEFWVVRLQVFQLRIARKFPNHIWGRTPQVYLNNDPSKSIPTA